MHGIAYFIYSKEKYIKAYKDKVLLKFISRCNTDLAYDKNFNIGVNNYKYSGLPVEFNCFVSKDGIYGKVSDDSFLNMAYVVTKKKTRKMVDGRVENTTVNLFYGVFGYIEISKTVKKPVYIKSNDFTKNYSKKRIELESRVFEKNFDCFSEDKIVALQILTTNTIEKINKMYESLKVPVEFSIKDNRFYFRILIDDIFAPPRFTNAVDQKRLKKIYDIIENVTEIIKEISDNIKDI